jgi:two-component system CheB/CheR fusion protein
MEMYKNEQKPLSMDNEITALKEKIEALEAENASLKNEHVAISQAKELYLKIFEEFPALIWRSRLDKLCDYFNKTWLEFTGRTMEQEFGNGWAEGVHPDDFEFCLNTYVTAFDKREAFLMEYRMKNKFNEYRWIRDFGRPFYDLDNTFLGYIGSCYDITEIKDNELRLKELNATKDKFFSIIAHDLKSPFTSIFLSSELLGEYIKEKDYSKIDEIARLILKSSKQAMDLLTNLMTWSQLESGRMPFSPVQFDIKSVCDEIVSLLEPTAKQKLIKIENNISPSLVFGDREMISTVLRNLTSNAIKYTNKDGKIKISSAPGNGELIVTVEDSGVGISKERLDKFFSILENNSTRGTQNEKGTGLGLILCKDFIDKNGGRIWVESTPGIGTSFSFTIPLISEKEEMN